MKTRMTQTDKMKNDFDKNKQALKNMIYEYITIEMEIIKYSRSAIGSTTPNQ